MEKIKLNNNQTFEIIVNGIRNDEKKLYIEFLPGEKNLLELETLFNEENTQKIYLLSTEEEVLKTCIGYTQLAEIEKQKNAIIGYELTDSSEEVPVTGDLIRLVLEKPNTMEKRVTSLEDTVDTLTLEILGI